MSTTGFLGMRGTGDWATDQRPKNYREGILRLSPNGDVPLTAITSKGKSRSTDDPQYYWWSKTLAVQGGAVTDVYDGPALDDTWSTETVAVGSLAYAKVAEAVANHFRVGHTVILYVTATPATHLFGKVIQVEKNGASSFIGVKILKLASTTAATNYGVLASCDYIDIVGNMNPEGGAIPDSISYDPVKFTNYTQIFRTPLDITRTARKTKLRTGDAYAELKRETLLYHGLEIEGAGLFSQAYEGVGANGKPERTTQGMVSFLTENVPANVVDYKADVTGSSWLTGGEEWIDEHLEQLFRYGRDTKLAFCGSGAMLGIMALVKNASNFSLTTTTGSYGVTVQTWETPFGRVNFKRHPLMSYKPQWRNSIIFFEPENVQYVYITDTHFKKSSGENEAGFVAIDGTKEEFLTECGFEWHFPETMMLMSSVGLDD